MQEIITAIQGVLHHGGRGALATVTETGGSAPQSPGSRMLLRPDGSLVGTVGGGAVEHRIVEALSACRAGEDPRSLTFDLGELGMSCGGRMTVFVEPIEAPPRLVIFGAGHVGRATAEMARAVDFAVTIVDEREELNTSERFPGCYLVKSPLEEALEEIAEGSEGAPRPWFLIVTHDHAMDEAVLEACLRRPHDYIGLIGSQRKVFGILKSIESRGGLPSLRKLFAPVGLDLGAESPGEIAVSIVAELVALRRAQASSHLRVMDTPLLARVLGGEIGAEEAAASLKEDGRG